MTPLPSEPEIKGYQPLISVIVPIYNVEQYLDKCLASICGQTYRNLQIVCVDDGSTDGSADILDRWAAKDKRICVVTKKNGGLSSARNAGLDVCVGEFVTGVDSDDWLLPDIYEKAVPHLTDECDMLVYTAQSVCEDGRMFKDGGKAHFSLPEQGLYEADWLLTHHINSCFWNKFWRRSVIEEHELRFPDGLIFEDEVFIRMFTPFMRCFYSLPEKGYMYVQRPGSIMHSKRTCLERAEINLAAAEWMCVYNETHDVPEASWNNLIDFIARGIPLKKGAAPNKESAIALRRLYADFIGKYRLTIRYPSDYRLKYVVSATYGWQRWFVSRSPRHQTFKFWCLPLLILKYKNGKFERFETFISILAKSFLHCL